MSDGGVVGREWWRGQVVEGEGEVEGRGSGGERVVEGRVNGGREWWRGE